MAVPSKKAAFAKAVAFDQPTLGRMWKDARPSTDTSNLRLRWSRLLISRPQFCSATRISPSVLERILENRANPPMMKHMAGFLAEAENTFQKRAADFEKSWQETKASPSPKSSKELVPVSKVPSLPEETKTSGYVESADLRGLLQKGLGLDPFSNMTAFAELAKVGYATVRRVRDGHRILASTRGKFLAVLTKAQTFQKKWRPRRGLR